MPDIRLSNLQQEAVDFREGALLVEASAGSGKTRVLTERIKKLITHSSRKVLAFTFTNKASLEMKERLDTVSDLNKRTFVGTIHGFCQQIVEQRSHMLGYQNPPHIFDSEADRLLLLETSLFNVPTKYEEYQKLVSTKKKGYLREKLSAISIYKRNLERKEHEINDIRLLSDSYQSTLMSQGAIDYDDLILLVYRLFNEFPNVSALYRREYEYICVDEAQDLNYAQYQLIKALAEDTHKNIMMVGDPNQSIFAFTGSSSEYMTKHFTQDFNPKKIKLTENYRSSRKVIDAALKIVPTSTSNQVYAIEGKFSISTGHNEDNEAMLVYKKIRELLDLKKHDDIEGEITLEKIAVLARNKYLFDNIQKIFEDNKIDHYFKVNPGPPVFESDVLKTFLLALKIKLNKQDSFHREKLKDICNCDTFSDLCELSGQQIPKRIKTTVDVVCSLSSGGENFLQLVTELKDSIDSAIHNNDDDAERLLIHKEIEELKSHWHFYKKNNEHASLLQFNSAMSMGQTHSLSNPKGITLSTVHTFKGQEKDIVFLIGMDEDTFPDYRSVRKGGIELDQEKNNAYVAFTRAKRFLYVSYPKQRSMPWGDIKNRKPSRFIIPFLHEG